MENCRFNEVITSEERFRGVMGDPMAQIIKKEISNLDTNCRTFIAKCPFVLISSCDAVSGKIPDFAIVVTVEQVFFHFPKCMIRSRLWNPETWPDQTGLPSLAQAVVAAAKLEVSVEQVQRMIDHDAKPRLY